MFDIHSTAFLIFQHTLSASLFALLLSYCLPKLEFLCILCWEFGLKRLHLDENCWGGFSEQRSFCEVCVSEWIGFVCLMLSCGIKAIATLRNWTTICFGSEKCGIIKNHFSWWNAAPKVDNFFFFSINFNYRTDNNQKIIYRIVTKLWNSPHFCLRLLRF